MASKNPVANGKVWASTPNLRAHVERFIQSLKQECLDKFVIVAERHLNHVNRQGRLHYNRECPHEASATRDGKAAGGQRDFSAERCYLLVPAERATKTP